MPSDRMLFRLAGLSALAGAALRLVSAIPSLPLGSEASERLYLTIDFLLLAGLLAVFAREPRLRGPIGSAGLAIATAGFLLIRTGPRAGPIGNYPSAAAVLSIGLAVLGAAALRTRGWLRAAGVAWMASLLVGLAGAAAGAPAGFLLATLLFCLGFGLAGVQLYGRGPAAAA